MAISFEAAKKLLQENSGTGSYKGYIPSLKKDLLFRVLSIGQLKSLAKLGIQNDTLEFGISQLAAISESCLDEIDPETMIDIDFISAMIALRLNNINDDIQFKMTCGCGQEFTYIVPLEKMEEQLRELSVENFTYEKEEKDIVYKIVVNHPKYIDLLAFEQVITDLEEEGFTETEIAKIKISSFAIPYIKQFFIGEDEIENFANLPFKEKTDFMDLLGGRFLTDKNTIADFITSKINTPKQQSLSNKITCPACKTIIEEGLVDYRSFFTL